MISAALKRPTLLSSGRAASTVAAEFAAASNNTKQSLHADLEAIFEDVQADVSSGGGQVPGSAAAAIGVPVAEEPLKPHHEGYFEARNHAEGSTVVEQESYSGAKLQHHFTRDVNAFLANPPVPGGSFDLASAAEQHGIDATSALKAIGIDSHNLAQATPRLMADLCKLVQYASTLLANSANLTLLLLPCRPLSAGRPFDPTKPIEDFSSCAPG